MTRAELLTVYRSISMLESAFAMHVPPEAKNAFSHTGMWDEIAAACAILERELGKENT